MSKRILLSRLGLVAAALLRPTQGTAVIAAPLTGLKLLESEYTLANRLEIAEFTAFMVSQVGQRPPLNNIHRMHWWATFAARVPESLMGVKVASLPPVLAPVVERARFKSGVRFGELIVDALRFDLEQRLRELPPHRREPFVRGMMRAMQRLPRHVLVLAEITDLWLKAFGDRNLAPVALDLLVEQPSLLRLSPVLRAATAELALTTASGPVLTAALRALATQPDLVAKTDWRRIEARATDFLRFTHDEREDRRVRRAVVEFEAARAVGQPRRCAAGLASPRW